MQNNFIKFGFMFLVAVVIDQITKAIFSSRDFFFGPIKLTLVQNSGLSFGINTENQISLIVSVIVMFALIFFLYKQRKLLNEKEIVGFSLIIAGAVSNLIDRVVLGFVKDFIDLSIGFTFNLADLFIAVGIMVVLIEHFNRPDNKKA